jgi:hypothetical protein
MKATLPAAMLATLFVASVCGKKDVPVDSVAPVLDTARLYVDDSPAFPDSTLMLIRDAATWYDIWDQATSVQASPPLRPVVDFDVQMVILAVAGRMSPGDLVRVDSAGVREGVFAVFVRTITECDPFPGESYPFELVRVARADEPAHWIQKREKAAHCQ